MKLTLIRGLPGSGKSTIAQRMVAEGEAHAHFEADMFHMVEGVYCFDPARIKEAHAWCLANTKAGLDAGYNVVVSNTFTQKWELEPYLTLGYETEIITATGNWQNTHNVPAEVLQRMRERWEE